MTYRISGLSPQPFLGLYGLSDTDLAARGVIRLTADCAPGYPDRITMREMPLGATALLLNHEHLPAASPYRSRHAIFVMEGAQEAWCGVDEIPEVMSKRTLSLRSYSKDGMMIEACLVEGADLDLAIKRLLNNPDCDFVHAHNAVRGCYSGLIERS